MHQLRNYQPNCVRLARCKTACQHIGVIIKLLDALEDTPPCGLADIIESAYRFRHRDDGNAKIFGDILHPNGPVHRPTSSHEPAPSLSELVSSGRFLYVSDLRLELSCAIARSVEQADMTSGVLRNRQS